MTARVPPNQPRTRDLRIILIPYLFWFVSAFLPLPAPARSSVDLLLKAPYFVLISLMLLIAWRLGARPAPLTLTAILVSLSAPAIHACVLFFTAYISLGHITSPTPTNLTFALFYTLGAVPLILITCAIFPLASWLFSPKFTPPTRCHNRASLARRHE